MNEPDETGFAWKLVWALAPVGLLYAALTITGTLPGVQATRWTALGLLACVGAVAGLRAPGRRVRHGLVAGLVVGLVAIWTQALFLDAYFANNPAYADTPMPFGLSPRLATFLLAPLPAFVAALVAGLAAWLSTKLFGRRFDAR